MRHQSQEVSRASFADAKHSLDIATEVLARQQADNQLTTALALEQSSREADDTVISSLISDNNNTYISNFTLISLIKINSIMSLLYVAVDLLIESINPYIDEFELTAVGFISVS
jgi:hypothetical protein